MDLRKLLVAIAIVLATLVSASCMTKPAVTRTTVGDEAGNATASSDATGRESTVAYDFNAIEATIRNDVAGGKLPSVAFAVAVDGRVIHENAFGWADKEKGRASNARTPYPLASTSKPIVATAVMMLAEHGRLDVQSPARRYAENWFSRTQRNRPDFTVQQLLNHTSGLGTYARIYWSDQKLPVRSLQDSFKRYGLPVQPAGVVSEYSNMGYGLLGHIVAERSGTSLSDYLASRIFKPLGMVDSMLVDSFEPPAHAAIKYDGSGARLVNTYNDTPGAGNIYASVHDLALFGAFHLGGGAKPAEALLGRRSRELMRSFRDPDVTYPYYNASRYGLGWYFRSSSQGEPVVWHEGGMPGASTILLLLPDRGIVVAVAINATDANASAQTFANALVKVVEPACQPISFTATDGFSAYVQQPEYLGRWEGEISVDGKPIPWRLEFKQHGMVEVMFASGSADSHLPARAEFRALVKGDLLVATIPATLPGSDIDQESDGYVLLRLLRRGDELSGAAVAYASAQRLEHLYPFAATLRKQGR